MKRLEQRKLVEKDEILQFIVATTLYLNLLCRDSMTLAIFVYSMMNKSLCNHIKETKKSDVLKILSSMSDLK